MNISSFSIAAVAVALAAFQLLWSRPAAAASSEVRLLDAARPASPLQVGLTRPDWTYRVGEPAAFVIKVERQPYPAEGVRISYRMGPDMHEGAERTALVRKEGLVLPLPAQTRPGFVRCLVTAELDGKPRQAAIEPAFRLTPAPALAAKGFITLQMGIHGILDTQDRWLLEHAAGKR